MMAHMGASVRSGRGPRHRPTHATAQPRGVLLVGGPREQHLPGPRTGREERGRRGGAQPFPGRVRCLLPHTTTLTTLLPCRCWFCAGRPARRRNMLRSRWEPDPVGAGRTQAPVKKHAWRGNIHAHSQFENRSRRKASRGLPLVRCFTGHNHVPWLGSARRSPAILRETSEETSY